MLIIEKLLGAVLMFGVSSLIPFLWWRFKYKRQKGFFALLGFIGPKLEKSILTLIVFIIVYIIFYKFDYTALIDPESVNKVEGSSNISGNAYKGLGVYAIIPGLIESFLMNGLAEELFFRGFLNKRLIESLGFMKGNLIQVILFAAMHNILYLLVGLDISLRMHIIMISFTGIGAFLLGYLNEQIFNGSVYPSIFLHGIGNFIPILRMMFM